MPEASCSINTFCTRQPILDAGQKIWGYEFLYLRDPQDHSVGFSDELKASLKAMAESLQGALGKDKLPIKICAVFPAQSVIDGMPYALPPEQAVIELQETEAPTQTLINSLYSLRKKKYTIALEMDPARAHAPELARIADVLSVDLSETPEAEWAALTALGREARTTLLARGIDTRDSLNTAREAGFALFEGFFFQESAPRATRRLSSLESTRLRLFRLLQSPEPDFGALGEVIQADVSLSYRLLSLLNSPAFKLVRRIDSVGQALVLLGWQQLKSWLLVVILSDLMTPGKCPELVVNSAQRAKFFELAAQKTQTPYAPETLFLLGLFSLLEPMMDLPMARITENLPLDEPIKTALRGQRNYCFHWLELAESFEARNWDQVKSLLAAFRLEPLDAANAYHAATLWANTMLTLF